MAEKKRPRRTRERILETSLVLFNRRGAPQVTTAEIAGEMGISPGNLYYHFRNKDEIVGELCAAFEERMKPLFADPRGRAVDVEDLWLWLHLGAVRADGRISFIFRDVDESRLAIARWALALGCCGRASPHGRVVPRNGRRGNDVRFEREIAASRKMVLVATYWQSFARIGRAPAEASTRRRRVARRQVPR
jgi:AcrR family transcriptional regulator